MNNNNELAELTNERDFHHFNGKLPPLGVRLLAVRQRMTAKKKKGRLSYEYYESDVIKQELKKALDIEEIMISLDMEDIRVELVSYKPKSSDNAYSQYMVSFLVRGKLICPITGEYENFSFVASDVDTLSPGKAIGKAMAYGFKNWAITQFLIDSDEDEEIKTIKNARPDINYNYFVRKWGGNAKVNQYLAVLGLPIKIPQAKKELELLDTGFTKYKKILLSFRVDVYDRLPWLDIIKQYDTKGSRLAAYYLMNGQERFDPQRKLMIQSAESLKQAFPDYGIEQLP